MRVLLLTSKAPGLPDVPVGPDIGLPNFSIGIWLGFYTHARLRSLYMTNWLRPR